MYVCVIQHNCIFVIIMPIIYIAWIDMHTQNNTCIKKYCFSYINYSVCIILSIFSNLLMIILTLSELYTKYIFIKMHHTKCSYIIYFVQIFVSYETLQNTLFAVSSVYSFFFLPTTIIINIRCIIIHIKPSLQDVFFPF